MGELVPLQEGAESLLWISLALALSLSLFHSLSLPCEDTASRQSFANQAEFSPHTECASPLILDFAAQAN